MHMPEIWSCRFTPGAYYDIAHGEKMTELKDESSTRTGRRLKRIPA
jgi:hypothetical protein